MNHATEHYYRLHRSTGETATQALTSAKREIFFRAWLSKEVKTHSRRSKAAKRGWAKRRAKRIATNTCSHFIGVH